MNEWMNGFHGCTHTSQAEPGVPLTGDDEMNEKTLSPRDRIRNSSPDDLWSNKLWNWNTWAAEESTSSGMSGIRLNHYTLTPPPPPPPEYNHKKMMSPGREIVLLSVHTVIPSVWPCPRMSCSFLPFLFFPAPPPFNAVLTQPSPTSDERWLAGGPASHRSSAVSRPVSYAHAYHLTLAVFSWLNQIVHLEVSVSNTLLWDFDPHTVLHVCVWPFAPVVYILLLGTPLLSVSMKCYKSYQDYNADFLDDCFKCVMVPEMHVFLVVHICNSGAYTDDLGLVFAFCVFKKT